MLLMFIEKPLTVISLPIFASLDVPVPSQQAANTTESPPVDISALLRSFGVSALNSFLQALIFARVVYYSLYTPIVDALSCFLRLVTTDASDLSTEGLLCLWECLSTSCPYQRLARSSWTLHLTCRIVLKIDHMTMDWIWYVFQVFQVKWRLNPRHLLDYIHIFHHITILFQF